MRLTKDDVILAQAMEIAELRNRASIDQVVIDELRRQLDEARRGGGDEHDEQ